MGGRSHGRGFRAGRTHDAASRGGARVAPLPVAWAGQDRRAERGDGRGARRAVVGRDASAVAAAVVPARAGSRVDGLRRRVARPHPGRPAAVRASAVECRARVRRVPARDRDRRAGRHPDGREPRRARRARSAAGVLPAAAAARVPAARRDLVRHRRDGEARRDLPRMLRADCDGRARRRARGDGRADQRRVFARRQLRADRAPRGAAGRAAGNSHRAADRDRFRLDYARRGRDGRRDGRARADGAQRIELPAHRHRRDGHPDHRCDRVAVRSRDAVGRAADRAVEGQRLSGRRDRPRVRRSDRVADCSLARRRLRAAASPNAARSDQPQPCLRWLVRHSSV
ncbi:hypothetical protein EMIT0111MI5_130124 [Burkholderia sp. IT-111MI5]